jgi:hypothetical protein
MKTLAIAAAAGLTLLAVGTTVVLAGRASGSGPTGVHLSAATRSQPTATTSPGTAQKKDDADEQSQPGEDEQGEDEQGEDERSESAEKDDDHQGTAKQHDGDQNGRTGKSER